MQRSWIFGPLIVATLLVMTGTDAGAQGTRFRADWLFLDRDNDGPQSTLISGADPFTTNTGFDYESGYRLTFSAGTIDWDVEARFSSIDDWTDSTRLQLTGELNFDSQGAGTNMLTFPNAIGVAAEYAGGGVDETTVAELLSPGANGFFTVDTDYRDFDITLKTSRQNWQRVGIGFRHIDFDEDNGLTLAGIFSSAGDDNALSDEALIAAGLTGGSGGIADGDPLTVDAHTINDNNLNGLQITYDAAIVNGSIWVFDVFANIGLYHNQITNRFTERYLAGPMGGNVYSRSTRDSENDVAWAGQLGFSGGVKLNDNWQFLAGYEVIYIDGLGLGIKLPPASGDESVLMHGGRLGFQGTW